MALYGIRKRNADSHPKVGCWPLSGGLSLPPGMLNSELTRKTMQVVAESQNVNDAAVRSASSHSYL